MKLSLLIATISELTDIDAGRVKNIARYLRENEILPSAGRGLSAAEMNPGHALDLLLACYFAPTASKAPETVRNFFSRIDDTRDHYHTHMDAGCDPCIIDRAIGDLAEYFPPDCFKHGFRQAFEGVIQREIKHNSINNFIKATDKTNSVSKNHFSLSLYWPFAKGVFFIRDTCSEDSDREVNFGGIYDGPWSQYDQYPSQRVALRSAFLINLAGRFRENDASSV